jgi:hypothetical protein
MDPNEIEQKILSQRLPDLLPPGSGWIMPHYNGLSIANLPATVAELLGAPLPQALPPLPAQIWADWTPGLRRVVLVVLDALGYRLLERTGSQGEGQVFRDLAKVGKLLPLTSVFPSTTDAALISMRSGLAPATHGWLAYTMYLREMGMAINAIQLCPIWTRRQDMLVEWGLQIGRLVTAPTLANHLSAAGIVTGAVLADHLRRSSFTDMLYKGVTTLEGHHLGSDLWVRLRHLMAETRGRPAFLTAYWSGLDTLGHAYGPDTDLWLAEFRSVSQLIGREFVERLPAEDREGTLLLITADHGQLSIPEEGIVTASEDAELGRHLMVPIVGESRAAFLYPRPGRREAIRAYLEEAFPGWFTVLDSSEALEAGLFGQPIHDETYARAGELLVLPNGNHALQGGKPGVPLLGRHGGLTQEEMLVPLIGVRLEAVA